MLRSPIQIIEELRKVYEQITEALRQKAETLRQELRLADPSRPTLRIPRARHPHAPGQRIRHGAVVETGITGAVRAALAAFAETFTVHDVIKAMLANGYQFEATNPRGAVSGVLRKLAKKHDLLVVRKGIAGKASVYKRWE